LSVITCLFCGLDLTFLSLEDRKEHLLSHPKCFGKMICLHCGEDLTDLSINMKIKHLGTHENEMTDRSKTLLEIVKDVDFDAINRY